MADTLAARLFVQRAAGKGVVLSRSELHMSGSDMRGQQPRVLAIAATCALPSGTALHEGSRGDLPLSPFFEGQETFLSAKGKKSFLYFAAYTVLQ